MIAMTKETAGKKDREDSAISINRPFHSPMPNQDLSQKFFGYFALCKIQHKTEFNSTKRDCLTESLPQLQCPATSLHSPTLSHPMGDAVSHVALGPSAKSVEQKKYWSMIRLLHAEISK